MSWTHLTLVTDADLGQLEPEAVASDLPWGRQTWSEARAEAKRDLQIWLESDYPDIVSVTDKIRDRWAPDYVWGYTGAAFTDYTTAANDTNEEDITLATVFGTPASDVLYVGADYEFSGLFLSLLDSLNAQTATLTIKYWDGGAWTSASATDGTSASGKTLAKSGRVTWTLPSNWERRDVNDTGALWFWVQVIVSATLTAGTAANQVLTIRPPNGLKRVAAYLALARVLKGLAPQAANASYWDDRAQYYWNQAEHLYARMREKGGIPIDLDASQSVEPGTAETRAISAVRLYRG